MNTTTQEPAKTADEARSAPVFWQDYQASRQEWFRTQQSFRWFQYQHKAELAEAGALVLISGRVFVAPDRFDAVVLEVGRRLATTRAA